MIRLRRLLIGEARRFPEIAADYYERAPVRVMTTIAGALDRFGRQGLLEIDDPLIASEHFAFLAIGARLDRDLFSGDDSVLPLDVAEDRARRGVDVFLRAYRPVRRPRARADPRRATDGSG